MLHGDDHLDAVEGQEGTQQQGVSDRVEPLLGPQVDGVVQVGERVVPVEPGGRVAEHGDRPERGRDRQRDREGAVPPGPGEDREQAVSVREHGESDRGGETGRRHPRTAPGGPVP
ncbi:hypothetical protein Mame01_10190 [Microbispora amethystogenes]|nr:hypothetical protein Mame01_10190 [Microbispora amethystogenes]